jgi:hypothetical protein
MGDFACNILAMFIGNSDATYIPQTVLNHYELVLQFYGPYFWIGYNVGG